MGMKKVIINNNKFELEDMIPEYNVNYGIGYVGFCYDTKSFVSKMIAKLTNYCSDTGIKISHALIVIDENYCIEADAVSKKVIKAPLSKYFNNPDKIISFRKPKEMNVDIARKISETAISKLGCPYEFKQIVSHAKNSLPAIHQFNKITRNFFVNIAAIIFDNPNEFICSELVAFCLKSADSWKYHNKGILSRPTCRVNPQELFEDKTIFKDWIFEEVTVRNSQV